MCTAHSIKMSLLDYNEVCAMLGGISHHQLKRLRLGHLIAVVRLGRRTVRYRREDVESLVDRMRVKALWE